MATRRMQFEGFSLDCPRGWADITDQADPEAPYTLADEEHGVGALQISTALHESGPAPNPSLEDLAELTRAFAEAQKFGKPLEKFTLEEPGWRAAGASYKHRGDFFQAWHLSDGQSFMLLTYFCDWADRTVEAELIAGVMKSIQFEAREAD